MTPTCGCLALSRAPLPAEIIFCPKHAAADAMFEALEWMIAGRLTKIEARDMDNGAVVDDLHHIDRVARDALTKAIG